MLNLSENSIKNFIRSDPGQDLIFSQIDICGKLLFRMMHGPGSRAQRYVRTQPIVPTVRMLHGVQDTHSR